MSRRSAALATLMGNGATVAITVAQAFILIPLALGYLDASLYGAWLAATELLIWIQFLDGGLPNLLTQRAAAALGRGDRGDAARWASTCFAGLAAISAILAICGFGAAPLVGVWSQAPPAERELLVACFRVGVLASILLLLSNGCVGLARGVQRTAMVNATQVIGALLGLVASIVLLTTGAGLWALALGLLVRSLIAVAGGVWFLCTLPSPARLWWAVPSRQHARELLDLAPSMGAASIGNVVANNSEIVLVNTFLGPVPALAYALTRRAFDGIRNLLDTIAWATAGGFAHMVTSDDRHRARPVLGEILWARLAVACLGAGIVLAVNEAFVGRLFGASNFGGLWLTLAFALQIVVVGQGFLVNYLWRAAGWVRQGSWMLTAEAVLRVAAMAVGLQAAGALGAPLASVAVSIVMYRITRAMLEKSLPEGERDHRSWTPALAPWLVIGIGFVGAALQLSDSWPSIGVRAAGVGVVGAVFLWSARPLSPRDDSILRWSRR